MNKPWADRDEARFLEPFSSEWHKVGMNEDQLIAALKRGDPAAMQALVDSCADRLLRSAFVLCGDDTEAQDLAQETLVQAFQSIHRFEGRSRLYTWLHAILLNLTRHYHRDRKRIVYDDDLARREVAPADEPPGPLDSGTVSSALLLQALRRLSGPHREVIVLRYYENMKIHEIATHLRISKGTVKSRLHYAIAGLQKWLPADLNLFGHRGTEELQKKS